MSFEIGQKVRVSLEVRDDDNALTDAAVSVSVMRPNLVAFLPAPTVTKTGTGLYEFDVTTDAVPGPWQWSAATSGAVVSVQRGQFWVRDPAMNLISLDEIKRHLNKDLTNRADDDELRDWIEAGRHVLEREVGPIVPRTVTETHGGGRRHVFLRQGPIVAVSAVVETVSAGDVHVLTVEDGVSYSDDQYTVDLASRVVSRRANGWQLYFVGSVAVTYMVGRYPIPMNYKVALGELVSHLWRASQLASGGSRPNVNSPDVIPVGYAVPNRVRELLGRRRGPRLGG